MTEYRVRVDNYAEVPVTRDDVTGLTRIEFRDRCSRTIVELPDVNGPDLLIQLVNAGVRIVDQTGYGSEIITPETLARNGGAE